MPDPKKTSELSSIKSSEFSKPNVSMTKTRIPREILEIFDDVEFRHDYLEHCPIGKMVFPIDQIQKFANLSPDKLKAIAAEYDLVLMQKVQ